MVISCPIEARERAERNYPKKHMLAPHIPYHRYLSLDFKDRLGLELKSLGLDISDSQQISDSGPFNEELNNYRRELENIIPKLEKLKNEILPCIDEYRKKDLELAKERNDFIRNYVNNN